MHLQAPAASVYAALRQVDRLVSLLPPLRGVRRVPDGATHWSLSDPEGWPLEWTAVVTELQPNRQIAWRTTEDSQLPHSGMVWLEPIDATQTRLHLYVSCRIVPGRTGQALQRLAGVGPQGLLTANLNRLRQHLQAGSPRSRLPGSDPLVAWAQSLSSRTH